MAMREWWSHGGAVFSSEYADNDAGSRRREAARAGRGQSRTSLEPLKRQLDATLRKLVDVGTIAADPRLETALVRQQEQRSRATE